MEAKTITSEESLQIIQQMISTAKKEQKDDGIGWIVWGWLLFATSVFSVINLKTAWVNQYFFWNIFGGITIGLSRFTFFRKKQPVKTYTGDLFQKLNIGYFISLMFIVGAINLGVVSAIAGFSFLINLYGFWALIYGTALNFKPSVVAAFFVWAIGIVSLFVKTFDQTMILHACAALTGFIIPGHIAWKQFKQPGKE